MMLQTIETAPRSYARLAGLLYLTIAVSAGFSIGYVPWVIVAAGDATATAGNVSANFGLLRLGILADIIVLLCEIAVTGILYVLLRPVNGTLSLIAAFSRLAMALVMGVNLLNLLIPALLLSGAGYLEVFGPDQLRALALMFLEAHGYGIYVWQLFFGLHLVVLGYLVVHSGYLPVIPGAMMMIGSFGYLVEAFGRITLTESAVIPVIAVPLLAIVTFGELSFALWLAIKGLNLTQWDEAVGKATPARTGAGA